MSELLIGIIGMILLYLLGRGFIPILLGAILLFLNQTNCWSTMAAVGMVYGDEE